MTHYNMHVFRFMFHQAFSSVFEQEDFPWTQEKENRAWDYACRASYRERDRPDREAVHDAIFAESKREAKVRREKEYA